VANRVTAAEVRAIVNIKASLDISAFITVANLIVTAKCAPLGYTADELKEIERWLAAHFVLCNYPMTESRKLGDAWQRIVTDNALHLDLTHPGQQVQVIDYLGGLTGIAQPRRRVSVRWLGTRRTLY